MSALKHLIQTVGLDVLYFSGASRLLRPLAEGVGTVLVLHQVRPSRSGRFQPNAALEVTPRFLERTIRWLRRNGYEFISLDEMRSRLTCGAFDRRFVTITLDDGYRDNKIWAQPILQKYRVPYTIYVPTSFAEGAGNLWWLTLEAIVARYDRVEADDRVFTSGTLREKQNAFAALKQILLAQPSQKDEAAFIGRLAARYRYDTGAATRAICMNWDELRELAADPLATIGATPPLTRC